MVEEHGQGTDGDAGRGPALIGPDGERIDLDMESYASCLAFLWRREGEEPLFAEFDSRKLNTGEAAEMLGVSRRTLTRMLDRGEIPCMRLGANHHRSVKMSDILAFKANADTYMNEVYASLARSKRDIEAGRITPAEEVHAALRAEFAERAVMAQAG